MINPIISLKLIKNVRSPEFSFKEQVHAESGKCFACGALDEQWKHTAIINDELASTWGLSDRLRKSFDARESMFCPVCDCSFRLRLLSEALVSEYGNSSLKELVKNEFNNFNIAEINSCGKLHQFLQNAKSLCYSEYGSKDLDIPSENLEALSYQDNSFDIILTSDTLEHVPNFDVAMSEIHRVLKPDGVHIFTIPVVWSRSTRKRAVLSESGIKNLLPPSYHGVGQPDYLVFNEFGYDVIDKVSKLGFDTKIFKVNLINLSDTSGVFIAKKVIT